MLFVLIGSSIGSIVSEPDLFKSLQTFTTSLHSTITRKKSTWSQTPSPPTSPTSSPSSTTTRQLPSRRLALLSLLPLLIYLLQSPSTITSLSTACSYLPPNVRSTLCHTFTSPTSRTVDLVIAYYDEDLSHSRNHIEEMRNVPFVRERSNRVVLYNKGPKGEEELRKELKLRRDDEVVGLPNYGREGATYLQHILLHYNASIDALANALDPDAETQTGKGRKLRTKVLADHTFFLQPHLAWDFIARPRIGLVGPDTGFAHFGPMMRSVSFFVLSLERGLRLVFGADELCSTGLWRRWKRDRNLFLFRTTLQHFRRRGLSSYWSTRTRFSFLPPSLFPFPSLSQLIQTDSQQSAWSAQFVVSKRRILSNAYKYVFLSNSRSLTVFRSQAQPPPFLSLSLSQTLRRL